MTRLENNHNVYILGAGFSADRGLPMVGDFMYALRDAHDWLESQGRATEARAVQDVLKFRLDAASAAYRMRIDLENIEELFSLASAATDGLSKSIQSAIAATLDYRLQTHEVPMCQFSVDPAIVNLPPTWSQIPEIAPAKFTAPKYEFYMKALLGQLDPNPQPGRNTIISFNYDCLVEEALSSLGVEFSYGFKGKSVNYDPSSSALKLGNDNGLALLKLHGSTNWGAPRKRGRKLTVFGAYANLLDQNLTPELVPPTWRKIFSGQLNDIWVEGLKAIATATRLVVIGFSIPETDAHFKYLLSAGLQNNISLRDIVFVNPDAERVNQRLDSLLSETTRSSSRLHVLPKRLSEFLTQGTGVGAIASFGRPMHSSVQNIW